MLFSHENACSFAVQRVLALVLSAVISLHGKAQHLGLEEAGAAVNDLLAFLCGVQKVAGCDPAALSSYT